MDVKVFFKTIVSVLKRDNIYVAEQKPVNTESNAAEAKETAGVNEQ